MENYPPVVAKIANDYLDRVKSLLHLVATREQDEFLNEIRSHLYEAYQQTTGEDEVARILAVLRNLGEPAEVVSDRLPAAMVRSGTKRSLPLYILGGLLLAVFGVPLGFGGVAVLAGILVTLAGILATFYATVALVFLSGTLFMLLGLTRIYQPAMWDKLITLGAIRLDGGVGDFLDQMTPPGQGLLLLLVAGVFVVSGLGMLWVGRHLVRGQRFLFSLVFEWLRQFGQTVRRKLHRPSGWAWNQSVQQRGTA